MIMAEMLRRAGASDTLIAESMPELVRRAEAIYVESCPNLERKTCPGVRRALERLERSGAVLGLVTGNLTCIGWKKMERAGLRRYFRFGAFGEMAGDRGVLVQKAVEEALRRCWIDSSARVSFVGDAPADILAAQAAGVQSIAVATGLCPPDELKGFHPDILLRDLRALKLEMVL